MFLGLDLGTSGLKGILIGEDQRIVAEANAPLTVSRPKSGWSEQAPADWISAAEAVMDTLAADGALQGVRGIGLSSRRDPVFDGRGIAQTAWRPAGSDSIDGS